MHTLFDYRRVQPLEVTAFSIISYRIVPYHTIPQSTEVENRSREDKRISKCDDSGIVNDTNTYINGTCSLELVFACLETLSYSYFVPGTEISKNITETIICSTNTHTLNIKYNNIITA